MNLYCAKRTPATLLIVLCLIGCAGSPAFREGRELAAEGRLDAALPKLKKAVDDDPGNPEYRATYLRTRDFLFARWVEQATLARREGKIEEAEKTYRRLLEEDPNNARARDGLADMARDARHTALLVDAEASLKKQNFEAASTRLRSILSENPDHQRALALKRTIEEKTTPVATQPQLAVGLNKPLTIEFKDAQLRQVFEILSRTSGLNFVFDKDVKGEQRTTIFLKKSTVQEALNLLMLTNQLEYRVLDASSVLIYPNVSAKLKDYQPLSVRTFLLSNVDAKTASNTLKTILRTKDLVVDEKQNLIIMRDTVDAIRMAEKLLALQDQAEPEIMLEVAIIEVSRNRLIDLGIQWPSQISLAPLANADGNVTVNTLRHLNGNTIGVTVSPVSLRANKQDGDVNILANPRIRARNRETAKILIGDRIPNITSTATATGFVSENVQYVDVGLKLEVQPTVNADNEVAIKISLEVSSVVEQIQTKSGSLAYRIGTRNASTLLKLRDGENQVLAGLIRNEESSTGNRIPGLGDIPLAGRLFGSQRDNLDKTEIVLSITPRLIRNARRPDFNLLEFESGTESSLKSRPEGISSPSGATPGKTETPFTATSDELATSPPLPLPGPAPDTLPAEAVPGNSSVLTLQGPQQVKAGSVFTVLLAIQPGDAVTSIPMAMSFDPKVLEVVSVTEGDFLKQGGGATSFSNRVDRGSGQIFATVTRSGKEGATSPGNIVSIAFRALSPTTESRLAMTAIAPTGMAGRAVNTAPPSPLVLSVIP